VLSLSLRSGVMSGSEASLLAATVAVILFPVCSRGGFFELSSSGSSPVLIASSVGLFRGLGEAWRRVGDVLAPGDATTLQQTSIGPRAELAHSVMVADQVTVKGVGGNAEGAEDALDVSVSAVEESASGRDMSLEFGELFFESVVKGLESEWEVVQEELGCRW
jgi:hypothetical protein